jgi:hypothetical protein
VVPGMNELLTPEQLAERLGVSLPMVRAMYYTNTWPHLRLNERTVRFTQVHLEEIIAMSERRPTTLVRDITLTQKADKLTQLLGRKKSA